jgi:8-oxo-dGTP pyrophosphatase MutT (NUDIX family)
MAAPTFPATQYPSETFIESAGAILFKLSTRQICILHQKKKDLWLLPKGRRDIGEARETTAVREVEEETGFKCRLLPVTMTTCQPRPGYDDYGGGAGKCEGICEPFMVGHRVLGDGKMKMIWWYVAAVDEDAEVGEGEAEFESELFGFEEVLSKLTFRSDREVVAKAVEIFEETFGKDQ